MRPLPLLAVCLAVVGLGVAVRADAGLINHWKFDEATGTATAADSAGSLDATLQGDADFVTDATRGQVLELDGAGDYASALGEPFTAKITHTVALWVKHDTFGGQRYISWGPRYFLGTHSDGATQGEGCISFAAGGSDKCFFTDAFYGGTDPTVDTSWHHWAVIFDGTSNLATIYRDGQFLQQTALAGGATSTTAGLRIGAQYTGGELFDGCLDDMAIWDEALTEQQIDNAMNLGAENYAVPEPSSIALCFMTALTSLVLLRSRVR